MSPSKKRETSIYPSLKFLKVNLRATYKTPDGRFLALFTNLAMRYKHFCPKGYVNLYRMANFAKIPQKSTDREFCKWLLSFPS